MQAEETNRQQHSGISTKTTNTTNINKQQQKQNAHNSHVGRFKLIQPVQHVACSLQLGQFCRFPFALDLNAGDLVDDQLHESGLVPRPGLDHVRKLESLVQRAVVELRVFLQCIDEADGAVEKRAGGFGGS